MAINFQNILDQIDNAIAAFIERIPASQTDMLSALDEELRRLDLKNGKIKPTVGNIKVISGIKNKLLKVILTDAYKSQVKNFLKSFNEITKLQNEYWKSVEKKFKPSSILKEIKKVAIEDTATKLMEAGIDANVAQPISDILTTNITQGGSYKQLQAHLKEVITTTETPGLLDRYTRQITVDSVNQYNRNYTQIVSSDLGYEWYAYQNTLINTSRPFCMAMHDIRYFHISQIPDLLIAKDLYYTNKKGVRSKVPLNKKTGLPDGMYATTNVSNFLTLLGGYNCGHQAGPVSSNLVKLQAPLIYDQVVNSAAYKKWYQINVSETKTEEGKKIPQEPAESKESKYDLDFLKNDSFNRFAFAYKNSDDLKPLLEKFTNNNMAEIVAIQLYGNTDYRQINNALRSNETKQENEYAYNMSHLLSEGLNKIPNYEGQVFRGTKLDNEAIDQYRKAYEKNEPYKDAAFISSTKNSGTKFDGNVEFIINSKTGKNVEDIMEFGLEGPPEGEVLFNKGTAFMVTEFKKMKGKTHIELTEK